MARHHHDPYVPRTLRLATNADLQRMEVARFYREAYLVTVHPDGCTSAWRSEAQRRIAERSHK